MKILSDEELKGITKQGRQSLFWMHKVAEAQARETAREILGEIEKHLQEDQWVQNPTAKINYPYCPASFKQLKKRFGAE